MISSDMGHWTYDGDLPSDPYGFIYEITNTIDSKIYIGKKQMTAVRKMAPLKGKKNKRHKTVETDWRTYTGSSNELNSDIEAHGKDKFIFKIVRFCGSKSEMSYFEAKEQFDRDVLLSERYYNQIINLRVGRIKL